MWRNYLATALNNLSKNKLFTVINIGGLAIGLAACILIGLYVRNETSYDRHWPDVERIYRIDTTIDRVGGSPNRVNAIALDGLAALERYFPGEIAATSRLMSYEYEVKTGDTAFREDIPQVDRGLLDIFDFEVLAGSLEATLEAPGRVALTEALALRHFGVSAEAMGQTLTLSSGQVLTVSAIYRLPPGNTVLSLPALTLLDESLFPYMKNNWVILGAAGYLKLLPGADVERIRSRLEEFTNSNVNIAPFQAGPDVRPADRYGFNLEKITDIYLGAPSAVSGSMTMVLAFSAISLLVLLIGCCNFTILSTAKATQRAREVALRKVSGAFRGELILQFIGESFMLVLMALAAALALVELALPFFESLVTRDLDVSYTDPLIAGGMVSLLLLVTLAGGLYPAFVLSAFRPASTLKANRSVDAAATLRLRSALVVFQFAISIALMVATAVIWLQVQYVAGRDPGFNSENLITINNLGNRPDVTTKKVLLRERLAAEPGVAAASLSGHQPMQRIGNSTIVSGYSLGNGGGEVFQLPTLGIDYHFMDTYEIPLVAGRGLDEAIDQPAHYFDFGFDPAQTSEARVLVNVAAARQLGFTDPQQALGAQINGRSGFNGVNQGYTIVGVVGDTQFFGLRTEPRAELYIPAPDGTDVLTVRYEGSAQQMMARIETVWREVMGNATLTTGFVDENMAREFARERTEARMLVGFSLLAIVVACLGLFGSAAFNVERRTKEIGIRKVLGAEVRQIVTLLLWQFSRPVLLANVFAWPVALWAMLQWLQRFPYRIDATYLLPLCLLAGLIALGIAWLTVAGNTLRVASARPVLALRYE